MRKGIKAALSAALALLVCSGLRVTAAEEAAELSARCTFGGTRARSGFSRLTDGAYRQPFQAPDGLLEIAAPEGESISWLYVCFADVPETWQVQVPQGEGWRTVSEPSDGYAHVTVPVSAQPRVRLCVPSGELSLHELRVFGAGALPSDVQTWQPTPEKADLLVLAAHPDDEFLFFGGLIPWYVHEGKRVVPAYMTCRNATRRAELLNGLWTAGLRTYPVIGDLTDRYSHDENTLLDFWTREEADYFVMMLLRRFQPEVLVTHGTGGEYGHAAHKICAHTAVRMFDRAADPLYLPQLAHRYGVWQPKKLYLHLEDVSPVRMDWNRDAGGKTALEKALEAFAKHETQQHFHVQCAADDPYDCSRFGLVRTAVGEDRQKNDLFENVRSGAE